MLSNVYLTEAVTLQDRFARCCQSDFFSSFSACPGEGVAWCVRDGIGILARVGTTGIPAEEGRKTAIRSARQKRPGGLRVLKPKASARRLHQRNGLLIFWLWTMACRQEEHGGSGRSGNQNHNPPRTEESCAGGLWSADFFGASPVASGLGHPLGRDPARTIVPRKLKRQAVLTVRLHDPTLSAGLGDSQLSGALGTFGGRHDLVAQLVVARLVADVRENLCNVGLIDLAP